MHAGRLKDGREVVVKVLRPDMREIITRDIEVLYDLDLEARTAAESAGLPFARAGTAGTHPAFVAAIGEAIRERLDPSLPKRAIGRVGPSHDTCAPDCCLPGNGRASPWDA